MKEQFDDFLKIHNKSYKNNYDYNKHLKIFHYNLSKLKNYTNGDKKCKMYLSRYSDLELNTYYDSCKGHISPNI